LRYSEWGVNIFGAALVANTDWLQANSDAAKAFVQCIANALKAQLVHPKMAIAAAKKHNSMLDEAIELASLNFEDSLVFTDNVRKNGLSYITPERLTSALAQVSDSVGASPPPIDRVWTRKYLPPASVLKVE
jgi:NitT/TauT family transport system substrate-binding protein